MNSFVHRAGVLVATVVFPAVATMATEPSLQSSGKPNVILVMTDDQGWGEVGFHGNQVLKTPNLDRFASEGTELTNFYVSPSARPRDHR